MLSTSPYAVPPAGRVGLAGQGEQPLVLARVLDAVQLEQVGDVAFLEADPAELHPADLGLGGADRVAGLSRVTPLARRRRAGARPAAAGGPSSRRCPSPVTSSIPGRATELHSGHRRALAYPAARPRTPGPHQDHPATARTTLLPEGPISARRRSLDTSVPRQGQQPGSLPFDLPQVGLSERTKWVTPRLSYRRSDRATSSAEPTSHVVPALAADHRTQRHRGAGDREVVAAVGHALLGP